MRRDKRISENMGLVHACVKRFCGKGLEYDDLFQAGCLGLIKAVDGFDPERGVQFSTYAVPVILGEVRRLFRDGGMVKVGRKLKELSLRAAKERSAFALKNGRDPSIGELAEVLEVEATQLAEAISAAATPLSLTASEDDGGGQLDVAVASGAEAIDEKLTVKQMMQTLENRDRALLVLRFFKQCTQVQTARILGMTQVQVSRREKVILGKLREGFATNV